MSKLPLLIVAVVLAATLGGVIGAYVVVPANAAATQPSAQCQTFGAMNRADKRQAFMNEQLAAGKSDFVAMPHQGGGTWLCAW